MRAFFIVGLFLVAFILVIANLIEGVDLTPNIVDAAQTAAPSAVTTASAPQVIAIQETPATASQNSALLPVTGGCSNPYIVQSGDSLSQITVNCSTTLVAIRQANPQIINANLIYPGQQVNIPNGYNAQVPVTGLEGVTPVTPVPQTCACGPAAVPVTGIVPILKPGSLLQVQAINFQPNTPVNVAIGPKNTVYTVVTQGVTDANGNLTTLITVPPVSNSQTLWVVVVSTTTQPSAQAMSQMFNIEP